MIVKQHSARSFAAVSGYLLHDKGGHGEERVEWAQAENVWAEDTRDAWHEMARTAQDAPDIKRRSGMSAAGRQVRNPAFHVSLSWAQDERPSREEMLARAREVLGTLGLERHQALIVCHNDEPHPHVHILASRIDPVTGRANNLPRSKRRLQDWALNYEREQGNIRCRLREENHEKLKRGEKPRYSDPAITRAWQSSDSGRAFRQALAEEGYTLALGNKRIVVVDPRGKAINPARELLGVRAADIKARLADIDLSSLPRANDVRKEREHQQSGKERAQGAARQPAASRAEGRAVGKEKGAGVGPVCETPKAGEARQARAPEGPVTETPKPAFARRGGQGKGAATGPQRDAQPPVFDRDRYNALWETAVIEEAIRLEQERARADSARAWVRGDRDRDNARRADLQSRHIGERIELERSQERRRLLHDEDLARQYDTGEARAELAALERKRWKWRKDRVRMKELRLNIADAAMREQETRATLESLYLREREALLARQERQRLDMERGIAQARERPETANDRPRRPLRTWEEVLERREAARRNRERGRERER
jgi:hypothetical protein